MILCIGTTPTVQRTMHFARLTMDDVNRATRVRDYASGKAVNVARVLTVLGRSATCVGFAGGRRGEFLREQIAAERIQADLTPIAGETRLCTTLIDDATGQVTELVEEAPAASPAEWAALVERVDMLSASAEAQVFSGTLAPGAPADWPSRWLTPGRVAVVDAKGESLRRACASPARVLAKLNRAEFEQTVGRALADTASLLAAMRSLRPADGALIVTAGRNGAFAVSGPQTFRVTSPAIKAVSPIGSGDAFAAGLAAAIDRPFDEALRLAAACGAANALTADSGHVDAGDVRVLIDQVVIESF